MHGVIRRYRGASALNDALVSRSQEVRDVIGGVPSFVAYYAVRTGDELATLTICEDQAGTQESSRRAAEWVRQNVPGAAAAAPEVIEGEVFIQHGR